jgi:hypothetical protein
VSDESNIVASLSASLPKGEANGLANYARLLADYPKKLRVVVALIDCADTDTKHDRDIVVAKARIRRIELITNEDDAKVMERIIQRAVEQRTGATMLPFELEDEVSQALADVKLATEDD